MISAYVGHFHAFGDSVIRAQSPSVIASPLSVQVAKNRMCLEHNFGADGTGIVAHAATIYQKSIQNDQNYLLLTGINDQRTWNASTPGKDTYQQALKAVAAFLGIPFYKKTLGQAGSFGGSWSNYANYGGAIGKTSSSNGATATFTVTGSTILVGTTRVPSGGTFTVTIDGAAQTSIPCVNSATDVQSLTYAPQLTIYSGLSNTSHTIILTVSGGAACDVDWVAGLSAVDANYPFVYIGNCLRMNSTGYGTYGGSDSTVATWNGLISTCLADVIATGLRVTPCDVSAAFDPSVGANIQGDGVHPTQTGHDVIAAKFISYMHS